MLKIRLQRIGRRNAPAFRVVVTESTRGPKSNDNLELLGSYNPHTDTSELKTDRIKEWISKGAQVSDTVHNLLVKEKVIEGAKINVLPKKSPIVKEGAEEAASASEEAPAASSEAAGEESPETLSEAASEEAAPESAGEKKEETPQQADSEPEAPASEEEKKDQPAASEAQAGEVKA